jgi:adenylate cyclase
MSRFELSQHHILAGCAALLLVPLAVFLYFMSAALDFNEHQRFLGSLRQIQASEAVLNQYLLRLRSGAVTSVDPINAEFARIDALKRVLGSPPQFVEESGRRAIAERAADYSELMDRKVLLAERFKAENANLRTAISYFPVISQELIDEADRQQKGGTLATNLQSLLRDVLLFNVKADEVLAPIILHRLSRLEGGAGPDSGAVSPVSLENLIAQVRTIMRVKPEVESLLSELLFIPTGEQTTEIGALYDRYYDYALESRNFYRLLLYLVAIVALAFAAWLIIRQLGHRIQLATLRIEVQNEQLQTQIGEIRALNEIAVVVSSVLDVNRVMEMILERTQQVMQADACSLLQLDEESGKLHFHVPAASPSKILEGLTLDVGQGIAGQAASTGETVLVNDAYEDDRFDREFDRITGTRTRSVIAVPLKSKREVVGVLEVLNKRGGEPFSDGDRQLLESMAAQAGVAIENSRLYERSREGAERLRVALERERHLSIEKDKLTAYIPKNVVDEISRNREESLALGGRMVRATILFSDMVGFTRLSENADPQEIVDFLNEYMTEMTAIVDARNGIVDKYLGDGIMAVFVDAGNEEHSLNAVRAAIEMQARLTELRRRWLEERPKFAELGIRIGINTGRVVAGNIGSATRMDYTVVGDNVNVASRIEGACKPGGIYISLSTYEDVRHSIEAREIEPISVKNRERPVQVYIVTTESDAA